METGFYARLRNYRKDNDALAACIDRVVNQLDDFSTTSDRPGMLLGKIQSGKTRAFIGVTARAFDRDFGITIILTKGTKTLSAQTVARLASDFKEFIEEDEFLVFDIMKPPGKLTRSELQRKLVIVAKKQTDNLYRLIKLLETDYPSLKNRNLLLVDDEADLASIRFVKKNKQADIEQGKIAEQMDSLRRLVDKIAFLQVTATPYSLYLQPESYENTNEENYVFKPKKPAFTELLPIHSNYVGGDDYFAAAAQDNYRSFLFVEVQPEEQDALRRPDQRRINPDRILDSPNTTGLVRAIITFILSASIRRWQQTEVGEKKKKYAMIIHNDTQKAAHEWQNQVIKWVFESVMQAAINTPKQLDTHFNAAYSDLKKSIQIGQGRIPTLEEAFKIFVSAFKNDEIVRETVNSDRDVMALLDDKAELKLRTPFNIFVGGNILDRGITIPNLIAFYYGRNPTTMQADTVLQHSRMYGDRDQADLMVTRFYTSREIYNRLYMINAFENALREAFESGAHERGVVFIRSDANRQVRPCAPNKVLLSNIVAIKPNGLYLPTGFETRKGRDMEKAQKDLNNLIPLDNIDKLRFTGIKREIALEIISIIKKTLILSGKEFDWDAMCSLLDYYSNIRKGINDEVLLLAATGRKIARETSGDKSGLSILGASEIRRLVLDPERSTPALILLQQEGTIELGWSGSKFWWPILAAPGTTEPCIFTPSTCEE